MGAGPPENTRRQRPTPFGPHRTHSCSLIRNGSDTLAEISMSSRLRHLFATICPRVVSDTRTARGRCPMTTEATTPAHAAPPPKKRIPRGAIVIGVLVAFLVVYVLSLFGVHLLARSAGPLKPPDLGTTDDTVVLMRLEELKTVANRLSVKVLVYPQEAMWDQRLDVLKTDTAVRMDPANDLGDLVYPAGKSPAQVATTVEAHGDPNNWPFDTYTTDTLT